MFSAHGRDPDDVCALTGRILNPRRYLRVTRCQICSPLRTFPRDDPLLAISRSMFRVQGIHHVTAIASDAQRNLDFYRGFLGLRLVKQTVNFDNPETLHFFFGDETGKPGSILSFLPWPGAKRGRAGGGQIETISLATIPSAIEFWVERLSRHDVSFTGPSERTVHNDSELVIAFEDDDGLSLEIVGSRGAKARSGWPEAPGVAAANALRGLHAVTIRSNDVEATGRVLSDTLGFDLVYEEEARRRFTAAYGGPGAIIDLRMANDSRRGEAGAGIAHHVALRVLDVETHRFVRERLVDARLDVSPATDRIYFTSMYFREPGGVLLEIATDGPGFARDEPVEGLGARLMLPVQYEHVREQIQAILPRLQLPVSQVGEGIFTDITGPEDVSADAFGISHRYIPPAAGAASAGSVTLLMLHEDIDEKTLMSLGRALLPGAGLLRPRQPLVAARVAPDSTSDAQVELVRATAVLSEFIPRAIDMYHLEVDGIVAVGVAAGADLAAAVLLRHPGLLRGAVLFGPRLPFITDSLPPLGGTSVFIAREADASDSERLAQLLRDSGARVTTCSHGGAPAAKQSIDAASRWIGQCILTADRHRSDVAIVGRDSSSSASADATSVWRPS